MTKRRKHPKWKQNNRHTFLEQRDSNGTATGQQRDSNGTYWLSDTGKVPCAEYWNFHIFPFVVCNMCFLTIGDNFTYSKIKNAAAVTANKRAQFTSSIQRRLARATIECADALDVIRRFDSEHCFFYVDPPYINAFQGHYSGYTEAQYEQLLERLAQIQGKFLLSAYPDTLLEKAAKKHKWTLRAFDMHKSASRKNQRKVEVLASNYA